jgi:hypothetical protein
MIKYIFLFFILIWVAGCNNSEADYSTQKDKNIQLKIQLTECILLQNGLSMHDSQKEEIKNKETLNKLDYEYIVVENNQLSTTLTECKGKTKTLIKKEVNPDSTGIWSINYYIDEFGEKTKSQYITNTNWIRGSFSNSATTDSKLNVSFIINNSNDISIKLYEYARNHPIKSYSDDDYYQVHAKGKDGNKFSFYARLIGNNIKILTESEKQYHFHNLPQLANQYLGVKKFHNILMDGGKIHFRIDEGNYRAEYSFEIENADGYKKAYEKLNK